MLEKLNKGSRDKFVNIDSENEICEEISFLSQLDDMVSGQSDTLNTGAEFDGPHIVSSQCDIDDKHDQVASEVA